MNAKELRIGNWVMGNKPFQVKGSDISLYESREKAKLKGILQGSQLPEPIPLTEEWLERFGFQLDIDDIDSRYILELKNITFTSNWKSEEVIYLNLNETHTDIEHVNQLQNLYFALTGQELKIIS